MRTYHREFLEWAKDHLGQGYSLEMEEGTFVDPVTRWCYAGYRNGRRAGLEESKQAVASISASHQKDTNGECCIDCDFVAAWDTAIRVIEELGK